LTEARWRLEENTAIGKEGEALNVIFTTIHGDPVCSLNVSD